MRKQLTGEPVAGELHSGFGGRGRRAPFPTPIQPFAQPDALRRANFGFHFIPIQNWPAAKCRLAQTLGPANTKTLANRAALQELRL